MFQKGSKHPLVTCVCFEMFKDGAFVEPQQIGAAFSFQTDLSEEKFCQRMPTPPRVKKKGIAQGRMKLNLIAMASYLP